MKKYIITILVLFFFTSSKSQLTFAGVETFNTLNQRFRTGASYITGSAGFEGNCVLESTILKDSGKVKIYYTAHHDTSAIALITTDSIGAAQVKQGIVIHPRSSGLNDIVKQSGTYYLYGVDWNGLAQCYLYTSTNGWTFTDQGVLLNLALVPNCAFYGNIAILKDTSGAAVTVGGKYKMIAEVSNSVTFIFELHLLESVSLSGPWTYVQKLTTLQLGVGSYSGACLKVLDGVYHVFYHYSSTGVLPTYLAYATSSDLLTWSIKEYPMKALESLPYGPLTPPFTTGTSQIADTWVEQVGTKTYMIAEYVQNSNPPLMQIYKWVYNGSFKQLITGLNNCLGCEGIYP